MKYSVISLLAALLCVAPLAGAFEKEKERISRKQAELDQACESAREVKLQPLRAQAFDECMTAKRSTNTAEDCTRKSEDVNGNRLGGSPRFYDLPACEAAFKHRKSHPNR
jgi:uncharacterized protein YgiB involved in biofilm formation